MSSAKDIVVIVNSSAGRGHGSATVDAIKAEFRAIGHPAQVTCVDFDGIGAAINDAVESGAGLIAIGGGDGTLSTAAAAMVDTDAILGILPLGTLNHFAKDQQIPLDIPGAVRTLVEGRVKRVDVGEVNGRIFINNSSIGIYPDIVRLRRRLGFGKWMGLAAATWMVLRRGSTLSIRLFSAAGDRRYETPFAFIGNNEYVVEGFEVGERKTLQAGELSVYTSRLTGRSGMFRLAFRSLFKYLRVGHEFETVVARDFVIEARERQLCVATDGEVGMQATPLRYRSRAGALRVMVPPCMPLEGC